MGLRLQTSTQWGAIKKIIATQPGVRYRVKLGYVHGGSVGGGMEVYNGGVESTQSIGGSGWLNKTTERVFEFVADSDMVMLKFFSGEVTGVEANMYLSKVEISIANSNHYSRIRGDKTYELSNHLGNVLATITDRKLGFSNNTSNNIASHYQAEVTSATDYYPFGSQMPDRSVSSDKARYGFNGMEKETQWSEGNYDFGARIYDSRIGRWYAVDPLFSKYPDMSSYNGMGNNPIILIDPDGAKIVAFFLKEKNEEKYKSVIKNLRSDYVFDQVYKSLDADYDIYLVTEFDSKKDRKKYKTTYGYSEDYIGSFLWADIYNIRLNDSEKINGIRISTVFEEFFHSGQSNYYWTSNNVRAETEAKTAKIYSAYLRVAPNEDLKKSLKKFGLADYEMKLLFDKDDNINEVVVDYFNKIRNGETITKELKESFKNEMKNFAKVIGAQYKFNSKELENYNGDTEYWDSLNKSKIEK